MTLAASVSNNPRRKNLDSGTNAVLQGIQLPTRNGGVDTIMVCRLKVNRAPGKR
jgi:hypothetical protein